MTLLKKTVLGAKAALRRALPLVLVLCVLATASPLALAKSKKKEEAAAPTKSYTVPYMIVIALVSIGLMTVARPSRRADKPPDKKLREEE